MDKKEHRFRNKRHFDSGFMFSSNENHHKINAVHKKSEIIGNKMHFNQLKACSSAFIPDVFELQLAIGWISCLVRISLLSILIIIT